MSDLPRIGFIGLGLMGQGFTKRLVSLGYSVSGYDIDDSKVQLAADHGVTPGASPAAVTKESDLVLLAVVSTDAVRSVVFEAGGIAECANSDKVLVDHSTTVVGDTKSMAAELRTSTGMHWVDAPVSGGPGAALDGTLAIMAGGQQEAIAAVEPVMRDLSSTFTHFGAVGAGQATKMVNQVLVLNTYCILAEALALAEAAGVDAAKIPQALAPGHAGSNMLKAIFPKMLARDFEPGGYARQVLKDLDMVQDVARSLTVPTPMSSQAANLYRILVSKGHSEEDAGAVLKLFDGGASI